MSKRLTEISKTMSWILRHGAIKLKIAMSPDGFVKLTDLLSASQMKGISEDDINKVVESDKKQRFTIKIEDNVKYIRANQGHSIPGINENMIFKPINSAEEIPNCIHGTYYAAWDKIKIEGLKTMNRTHIHFTNSLPKESTQSGIRSNCQLYIYINVSKAMNDGIKFFLSDNNVILTKGVNNVLLPEYFLKVLDKKTMENIL